MRCQSCNQLLDFGDANFCPVCGLAVEPAQPDPLIGELVGGRYRITHLVAEGGMGRVYAAEQTLGKTVRKVAIKVLLSDTADPDQDSKRFLRECSTVAELEHPNTIKFYDFGETSAGDLFIAMEFLSGKSLAQVVGEGALPPERVDLIVGQICGSLQEAHERGIVHRDLKPDNIVITSPGGAPDFVKVLDFGIAKRMGGRDPKLTPLGVVLGSPPYMSPEQFTLQDIDARSDIYSLAVLTYQLLTGRLPFDARDPLEWAALHMTALPDPLTQPGVPPQMRGAVMRALQKKPDDRPSTLREFFSEFTLGSGSIPPGRVSSMLPFSSSEIPLAPRAPLGLTTEVSYDDSSRIPVAHLGSAPDISVRETGMSFPGGEPAGRLTSQGTLMIEGEPAKPTGRITMPDLLPPTVRDPAELAQYAEPSDTKRLLFAALGLVFVGALLGVGVWFFLLQEPEKAPSKPRPIATAVDAPPTPIDINKLPPEIRSDPFVVKAVASASSAPPDEKVSPCQTAVYAAVTAQCELARRAFSRCMTDNAYHASAQRTVAGLCPAGR